MTDKIDREPCRRCGVAWGERHRWVEGDCVLPHRKHSRRLVEGTFVCEPCTRRWDEWLTEITELYATLSYVVDAGSVPDYTAEHTKPRKREGSPAPIRLTAWALLFGRLNTHVRGEDGELHPAYLGEHLPNVPAVLSSWAQAVFDALGWTHEAPTTVSGAAAVCRANRETLAGLPEVDTFDAELRWVRRALRTAHGLSDPVPLGECLSVGCGGNVWPAGGSQPRCDRCGRRYGTLDLVRLRVNEKAGA